MRLHQLNRRVRIFTTTAAIVGVSVSAFGQTGQSRLTQSATQGLALQPGESLRRLSIDEAVKLGLEQNLGIQIQRYDPQIQDTAVAQARSFWAPQLSSTFSRNSGWQTTRRLWS